MGIKLLPDLIRQWTDTRRLVNQMHHDMPPHLRNDWQSLPWTRYHLFYGVLVPVIIHDALFRLHKTPSTKDLRNVVSAQALITGLFDDLFDHLHLPPDRIRELMHTPDQLIHSDFIEEYLCQNLFREIHYHFTGDQKLFGESVEAILKAQKLSAQQRQNSTCIPKFQRRQAPLTPRSNLSISIDDILYITKKKGAKAVLFYRSCIDQPLTTEECTFLSELGGLFQMTNDINDALKNQQAGETTFMTMGLTLREIRKIFDAQIRRTFESWKSLPEGPHNKMYFFSRINILLARSLVTLDRYGRFVDQEEQFDIQIIPPNKVISGLKIPYEIRHWSRQYRRLKQ